MSFTDDALCIFVSPGEGELKNFSITGRGKVSTVKIELEITDPHALSMISQRLHEGMGRKASPRRSPRAQP